jgi:Xaa-Pro aminopeptidase
LSGELIKDRPSRVLKPGMVLTIEPGIYVRPAPGVPERFHNIGIRIEDDAVVTAQGCELMTRGVPVKADEIEALMRH